MVTEAHAARPSWIRQPPRHLLVLRVCVCLVCGAMAGRLRALLELTPRLHSGYLHLCAMDPSGIRIHWGPDSVQLACSADVWPVVFRLPHGVRWADSVHDWPQHLLAGQYLVNAGKGLASGTSPCKRRRPLST